MQTRRRFMVDLGLTAGAAALGVSASGANAKRVTALERDSHPLTWDNHSGFDPRPNYDLNHLEQWRRASIDYLSIDVGYDVLEWTMAVQNLASYITWLDQHPHEFVLAKRADDVTRAKQASN